MSHRDPGTEHGPLSLRTILLLGLIARAAAVVALNRLGFSVPGNEHWQVARSLYEGSGFAFDWYGLFPEPQVGSFLPPLYPWVLLLSLGLAGGREGAALWIAQGWNVAFGTATIWLVARLSERVRLRSPAGSSAAPRSNDDGTGGPGPRGRALLRILPAHSGRLAALAWAFYPPAIGHAAQAQSQVLETFLLLLLGLLVLPETDDGSGPRAGPSRRAVLAGLTLGALLLARPATLLIWGLWCAWLLFRPRAAGGFRRVWRFLLLSTGVAAIVLAPWTVRNFALHGRLVPVSTNGGFNFYMGNNPAGDGGIPPLVLFFPRLAEEERRALRAMTETERDRHFYALGLEYWRTQPGRALRGVGNRLVSYLLWRPYLFAAYPRWVSFVFIASYLLVLGAFLLSLRRCRGPALSLALLAILGTGIVGMIWIVSMRFRATVEPFLVAAGAAALRPRLRTPR